MSEIIPKWHKSIEEITESNWKSLSGKSSIPFYEWQWLRDLEKSDSIIPRNGWQPLYLALWRQNKAIAVAPLYLKGHSRGEFIFDNLFIELAEKLGLEYYPKLIGMSPLSPVEGYRFFIDKQENEYSITMDMMREIDIFAINNNILSCNFLYVDPKWIPIAKKANCRDWLNSKSICDLKGLSSFSDYLNIFNANQRRNIKRERKAIEKSGIKISIIEGPQINYEKMDLMYQFYSNHCSRWGPWGSNYLSKNFFTSLSSPAQQDKVVLFNAYRENSEEPIAMSMCIYTEEMLWGRYWGSSEEIDSLHFECCYYAPIEWAIERKIKSFDPGAGGSHKLRRGFKLQSNTSLHRWYNKRMDSFIAENIQRINAITTNNINIINSQAPFHKNL